MPSTVFDSPTALGAKIITVETTVTNVSGAYTTTVNDERITVAMKAIDIEIEHPEVFHATISVTCNNGSVTISCADVSGESDITLSILKVADDPTAVTSSEFDILDNRKVNKQQNVSDAGKVLGIGSDGVVTPVKVGDGTLRVVPFSIGVASWTLSNGVYSYTVSSAYVTLTSVEFIEYDSSYRTAVRGDVNATKATGGGGVVFTTDVLPVATLSGEIRVFDSDDGKVAIVTQMTALPTMREVPFTITASQWALNADNLYEAVFATAYVTATSHDFVEFDESIENATDGIKVSKAESSGSVVGMKFLSRRVPAGSISGTITPLDNADGKIAVALEDTVMPISNGGTGANTLAGAQQNLGITALQEDVEELNNNIKVLTGTTGATGSTTTVPFPTGFDRDNTVLLNFQYFDDGGWRPVGSETGWANMSSFHPAVTIWTDGVHVYAEGSHTANKDFKVTIMKHT